MCNTGASNLRYPLYSITMRTGRNRCYPICIVTVVTLIKYDISRDVAWREVYYPASGQQGRVPCMYGCIHYSHHVATSFMIYVPPVPQPTHSRMYDTSILLLLGYIAVGSVVRTPPPTPLSSFHEFLSEKGALYF